MALRNQFSLFVVCLTLALAGCAKSSLTNSLGKNTLTGAKNLDGKPFTGFVPEADATKLRSQIPETDDNKAFAASIERADLVVPPSTSSDSPPQKLQVKVKLKDTEQPLLFQGSVEKKDDGYVSEMTDTTNQRSDLKMVAVCSDPSCSTVTSIIGDKDKRAGIIMRKEDRVVKAVVPPSQDPQESAKEVVNEFKDGKDVTMTSTEVLYGKSYYQMAEKPADPQQPVSTLSGDLVATDGDVISTRADGKFQKLGQPVMFGNTEDGEGLAWKFSDTDKKDSPPVYMVLAPRKKDKSPNKKSSATPRQAAPSVPPAPRPQQSPEPAPVPMTTEPDTPTNPICEKLPRNPKAHPFVEQILKDCSNDLVEKKVDAMVAASTKSASAKTRLLRFLKLNTDSLSPNPSDEGRDWTKMIKLLQSKNFPAAMSFVSVIESDFTPTAKAKTSSAYGWWQFVEDTARRYGLIDRTSLEESTNAAIRYYSDLLKIWNNDLKMAILSYTWGEGATKSATRAANEKIKKEDTGVSLEDLTVLSRDFWTLCRFHTLKIDKRDYVLVFVSGVIVASNPEGFGLGQYSPIDLN